MDYLGYLDLTRGELSASSPWYYVTLIWRTRHQLMARSATGLRWTLTRMGEVTG